MTLLSRTLAQRDLEKVVSVGMGEAWDESRLLKHEVYGWKGPDSPFSGVNPFRGWRRESSCQISGEQDSKQSSVTEGVRAGLRTQMTN